MLSSVSRNRSAGSRSDHVDLATNQVDSEFRQSLILWYWRVLNRHVLALGTAGVLQTLTKCLQKIRGVGRELPDDRHRRLLRTRRERPRNRRAADERDELAPLDVDYHATLPGGHADAGGTLPRFHRVVCDVW